MSPGDISLLKRLKSAEGRGPIERAVGSCADLAQLFGVFEVKLHGHFQVFESLLWCLSEACDLRFGTSRDV